MALGDALRIRVAALTGAKACLLGSGCRVEKRGILTLGAPRRTGWPAVNAGGFYREHKLTVATAVALQHRLPMFVRKGWICCGKIFGIHGLSMPYRITLDYPGLAIKLYPGIA